MLMLTGDTRSTKVVAMLRAMGWGRIWIDRKPTPYEGEPWGFDNGAFRDWRSGTAFDEGVYLRRLERAHVVGRPYLAIVPDIVAGGRDSLQMSLSWLDRLPSGWPWYLAVQDGMIVDDVEPVLTQFAGLFLGGSNHFKATAYYWCELAHAHGKLFHYGRASTHRKIHHALEVGSDSADSAFPLWTCGRLDELRLLFGAPVPKMFWNVEETSLHPNTARQPADDWQRRPAYERPCNRQSRQESLWTGE